MIFDITNELNWHELEFTFKMYPGETFEDTDQKVALSLGNFPYLVHTFYISNKRRTGEWGQLITLTVNLGIFPEVTLEEVLKKFDNVTHLQSRKILD